MGVLPLCREVVGVFYSPSRLGKVISETEVYFEVKDKSFNKNGIELLEKRWNQCITLEGDYVDQ